MPVIASVRSGPSDGWTLVLAGVLILGLLGRRELKFLAQLWWAGLLPQFVTNLRRLPAIRRSHATLTDHPAYPVLVPAGEDGSPGLTVTLPAMPVEVGVPGPDGSRRDFQVLIAPRCFLMATCAGPVERVGTAWQAIVRLYQSHPFVPVTAPTLTTMAGQPAMTCTVGLADRWLTEWRFERDGWLFSAGFLRPPQAPDTVTLLAMNSLATWTWLAAAPTEAEAEDEADAEAA